MTDREQPNLPAAPAATALHLGEEAQAELRDLLRGLPKVELHRHLPGSYRLQTLLELAREYRLDLPAGDLDALRRHAQVLPETPANLGHILRTVSAFLCEFFVTREAIARLAYEMVEDAWRDGIIYLEARFSPWSMGARHGLPFDAVLAGAAEGMAAAQQRYPMQTGILLGMTREAGVDVAAQVSDFALGVAGSMGVTGVDLSGDEEQYPAQLFVGPFERIRRDGRLGITIHAGEAAGPESVRTAIEVLGARRIGHGVRVVEDRAATEFVRTRQVVLETCPTSNVRSGAVSSFAAHPLRALLAAGVRATISTDDPGWFDITLTDEYMIAVTKLGLTFPALRQAALNAAEGAFLPAQARADLSTRIRGAYDAAEARVTALLAGDEGSAPA